MGGELYDLNKPDEVTLLIKHFGSALKNVFAEKNVDHTQTSQTSQARQTRQTTRSLLPRVQSEEETPPSKKKNTTSKYFYVLLCLHYSQISLQNFILYFDHTN